MIPIYPANQLNTIAPLAGQPTLSGLSHPPPLALYIHIPWCVRKCPYCDFNSHEAKQEIPEDAYVEALIADLEQATPLVWGRKIRSIFFGGGTPSLFSDRAIDTILSHVRMLTPLEYDAEVTLEANPGTVDVSHFTGYRQAGVNRISMGIQSFNNTHLKALGRIHDQQQALNAIEIAMRLFSRVNLDIMYGLPHQTLDQALQDVNQACAISPSHLSCYHLTLEPNTPFYHQPPAIPDDDSAANMQEAIEQTLASHGYQHYETSAFSKPGEACRHNLNYWTFGDYLGIGAGAHSKLSFHDKIIRQSRHKHPKRYLESLQHGQWVDDERIITRDELGFEFMMNALRLTDGVEARLFELRTGLPLRVIQAPLEEAERKGLLTQSEGVITPTLQGQRFLNELLQLFLA